MLCTRADEHCKMRKRWSLSACTADWQRIGECNFLHLLEAMLVVEEREKCRRMASYLTSGKESHFQVSV